MTTFRRALLLSLAALLLFCPMVMTAKAGDIAGRRVLGFSPDGTRFAFEEFGIEDGSGFPQGDSIHRMLYASEQDSKRPHDQEGALR